MTKHMTGTRNETGPKHFTARSGFHRRVVLEVEGDAVVRQFKCKLDAAGETNVLTHHGESLSLRFNDPNV